MESQVLGGKQKATWRFGLETRGAKHLISEKVGADAPPLPTPLFLTSQSQGFVVPEELDEGAKQFQPSKAKRF